MATIEPSVEIKGAQPNLRKLLKPTKYHPKGRIKIDPDTGEVAGPKNNIVGYKEKIIRQDVGGVQIEIARVKIPINGGHVKAENSVWRIALGGPKKYHEKKLLEQKVHLRNGDTKEQVAPTLEIEEAEEYAKYLEFLKETGKEIAENAEFYAWLKKAKKEVK